MDKANNTSTYKPGSSLPLNIIKALKANLSRTVKLKFIKEIYPRHHQTQNRNETFDGLIWHRVPKYTYTRPETFETSVYDAVAQSVIFGLCFSLVAQISQEPFEIFP